MGRTSEEPPLRMESKSASDVKSADTLRKVGASEEPQLRKGWNTQRAAVAEGRSFWGADSAEDRKVREPVRRRKEWERSRRCGWEIDVGADVAAVMMVPGADTSDG